MKLIVGITGASGVEIAYKFLSFLPESIETFAVVSENAKTSYKMESGKEFGLERKKNITIFEDGDLGAPIASGSFKTDAMIILPCSMNTLAKCTIGLSDTLITRAFSVMLKERKKIILSPREMPYNQIHLENMTKLSSMGVSIAPPVLGYYSKQQSLEDMERFLIGKWYDLLGIENDLYKRWNG